MKTTEKPERTKDSRSRDSSPRPQTQTTTRKRARTRTATLQYYDNPELDKVKRYFIGKELQKVWGKVSYTGRQKIVKHYATLNFIICEDEVEEPPADEDNSLICQPMEPEVTPVYSKFEFEAPYNSETLEEKLCSPSQVVDFTETLKDVPLLVSPVPCTNTELTLDYDSLCLRVAIEPVFDFFEFICDDTWSKAARTIQRFFKENWTKRMMIKVIKMNLMLKRQEALAQKKKMKRLASKAMAANSLAKKDG